MKKSFASAWHDYQVLLGVGGLYAVVASAQILLLGAKWSQLFHWIIDGIKYVALLGCGFVFMASLGVLLLELLRMQPANEGGGTQSLRRAWQRFMTWLKAYLQSPLFAHGCLGLIVCFQTAFFLFQKSTVRFVHPYAFDQIFVQIDKFIHFGRQPYEWMIMALQSGVFDNLLQLAYFGWFFVMYFALGCSLFCDKNRKRRLCFIWVFGLSWYFLGGIGATVLSSVCPVFYHDFYPNLPDPYAHLLEYMQAHKAGTGGALLVQAKLLEWNNSMRLVVPNGIAAMPSLHTAIAWLVFLYTRSMGRWVSSMALAFALMIFTACVYFGFQYANDSYFYIIAVSLMWWAVSRHLDYRIKPEAGA